MATASLTLRNETSLRPMVVEYVAGQEFELSPTELPHVHVWDSKSAGIQTLVIRDDRMYVAEAHSCGICGMMTSDNGRTWGRPHLAAIPAIIPEAPKSSVSTVSGFTDAPMATPKEFKLKVMLNALTGIAVAAFALWTGLALVMALGLMAGTLVAPSAWFRAKPRTQRIVSAIDDLSIFGFCRICVWWEMNQPVVWRRKTHRLAMFAFAAITLILANF